MCKELSQIVPFDFSLEQILEGIPKRLYDIRAQRLDKKLNIKDKIHDYDSSSSVQLTFEGQYLPKFFPLY